MNLNSLSPCISFGIVFLALHLQSIGSRSLDMDSKERGDDDYSTSTVDTLLGNSDNENTSWTDRDIDPCALVLEPLEGLLPQSHLITISHPVFTVSNGVVPGVTYQVSFEIPVDHHFVLEYWLNLSGAGSDDARLHSYPPSNNKKRRHQRDRRENQWMEVVPEVGSSILENAAHQTTPCSRNAFGGIYNDSSRTSPEGTSHVFTFTWFLKANPFPASPSANVVFRLRFKSSTIARSSTTGQSLSLKVIPDCNLTVNLRESESTQLTLASLWNPRADNVGLNCTVTLVPPPRFGFEARFSNLSVYGIRDLCKGRFLLFGTLEDRGSSNAQLGIEAHESELQVPFQYKFCGKIEEYNSEEKVLPFSPTEISVLSPNSSSTFGILLKISLLGYIKPKETFSLDLTPLSPCDKVTLSGLKGHLTYDRSSRHGESFCSIVIHVPYGNTIHAELRVDTPNLEGPSSEGPKKVNKNGTAGSLTDKKSLTTRPLRGQTENVVTDSDNDSSKEFECILNSRRPDGSGRDDDQYFIIRVEEIGILEGSSSSESEKHHRIFCLRRRRDVLRGVTLERRWKSLGNRMKITFTLDVNFHAFQLVYFSESVNEIRRDCDEGWVHVDEGGCVLLVEKGRSWTAAEEECQEVGGHLVTVKNDLVQRQLQKIIIKSASFTTSRAYWIGASDRESEGNFQWTSGLPFIFTNWFPGSRKHNGNDIILNVQPNDDGLSGQDCVELRQEFAFTSPGASFLGNGLKSPVTKTGAPRPISGKSSPPKMSAEGSNDGKLRRRGWALRKTRQQAFHWNDRNCQTLNFFLCERATHPGVEFDCNRTVRLSPGSAQSSSVTVTSPAYPSSYPDNTLCITRLETVPGYRLIVTFDEFHLEESPNCEYDSLELEEVLESESQLQLQDGGIPSRRLFTPTPSQKHHKICGDWNRRLKLLRYVSASYSLNFRFESDFSHALPGFKTKITAEKVVPRLSYDEEVREECEEQRMHSFRNNCYFVVSSPSVNYEAAQHLCSTVQGNLASIVTVEEWRFVTQTLVSSPDYQRKSVYWVGGYIDKFNQLAWKDRMPFNFSAFHPSDLQSISEWKCLSIYWHEGGTGTFAWRLSNCNQASGYVCKKATNVESRPELNRTLVGIGGKLSSPNFPLAYKNNLDYTVQLSAPSGTVIVLQFLHLDIELQDDCLYDSVNIIDQRTRNSSQVCGTFSGVDLERFDFVSTSNTVSVVFHSDFSETASGFELIWRAVDVTECLSGKTILTGLGNGFLQQGSLHSPNFPYFNLPNLNCIFTIVAPAGQRIWLHFDIFEVGEGMRGASEATEENGNGLSERNGGSDYDCSEQDHVMIDLLSDSDSIEREGAADNGVARKSIFLCGNLTTFPHRTSFVSYGERIRVRFISRTGHRGRGFLGKYKAAPPVIKEQLILQIQPNSSFFFSSLNFPFQPPPEVNLKTVLTSPPNYMITLEIRGTSTQNCHLKASSYIVIHDPYVGTNGTSWIICHPSPLPGQENEDESAEMSSSNLIAAAATDSLLSARSVKVAVSTTSFQSTFNRLEITQIYSGQGPRRKWNAEVVTSFDQNFRDKVLSGGDRLLLLDACSPNPCLNGGKCVTEGDRHICRCLLPYTGPFCGLSVCDLSPCLFGDCVVEGPTFRCNCHVGYAGDKCDRRAKPCMRDGKEDKCNGHGECVEVNDSTYKCLCHYLWEGPRCEGRMQNIPFRPLSERMLREPFWLGIITVTVVLGVIGLVWCLKRHFPEKLEKFLNDDLDRNRRISWVSARSPSSFRLGGGCSYHGVRDPVPGPSQQATSPQAARSFLGRFGIRKPSLLSLSSATSVSAAATSPHTYENRTFSLDDLLRPSRSSMMRTPSPHRRRNFSIHSRRDPMEKQQILQQLVSSGASVSLDGSESKPSTPKPTIAEIIQMSEKRLRLANLASASSQSDPPSGTFSIFLDKATVENETSFSTAARSGGTTPTGYPSTSLSAASKAEKKVTFARLLDKLTAHEMSSSSSCSDLSCAEEGGTRTIMVNPKPPKKDRKGRLKRSKAYAPRGRNSETDQDGFEMSSSDTTPDPICPPRFPSRACVSPTGLSVSANNSPSFKSTGKSLPKMASADSLLALFRRFSGSSSAPPSPQYSENEESSAGATPLSTPSSPRNSALSLNIRPPAFLITTPESSVDASTSPGHDQFSAQGGGPGSWRSQAQNMSVISLEVPMREHCLSPIHEVPTPLPTPSHSPAHSPMMHRQQATESTHAQGLPMIKLQPSSEAEDDEPEVEQRRTRSFPIVIPKIAISQEGEDDCMVMLSDPEPPQYFDEEKMRQWAKGKGHRDKEPIPDVLSHLPTDSSPQNAYNEPTRFPFDMDDDMSRHSAGPSSPSRKVRPPPLVFANEIMSETKTRPFKERDDASDCASRASAVPMSIPLVQVQDPTPIGTPAMTPSQEELEPCQLTGKSVSSVPPDITAFAVMVSPKPWEIQTLRQAHAPLIPPMIMINQNSEAESDSDTTIRKLLRKPNLAFLSPFAGTSDRVPSESNLSTSGYSSMASPCPSRCPSVSPLCPDIDEYHVHHHGGFRRSSLVTPGSSRKSSLTLTPRRCSLNATSPLVSFASNLLSSMGSTGGISNFGESMELLAMEMEADSALEVEMETDAEIKKPESADELSSDFMSLSHLLQVPRKNLPKSHSLDMDVPEHDTSTALATPSTNQRRPAQSIRKGDSLDSKLNSFQRGSGTNLDKSNSFSPILLRQALLNRSTSGSRGLIEDRFSERKRLSPVSSRSDSSMSELSVIGLAGGFASPITDSDGVYDNASSEVQSGAGGTSRDFKKSYANSFYLSPSQQSRRSGRRKNRRRMSSASANKKVPAAFSTLVTDSRGKGVDDLGGQVQEPDTDKEALARLSTLLRPLASSKKTPTSSTSPKRRVRAQTNLDATSSSSETINSLRSSRSRMSSPAASPKQEKVIDRISPAEKPLIPDCEVAREEGVAENIVTAMPISPSREPVRGTLERNISQVPSSGRRNISRSRLRTISVQIRFLRRLERSLVRKKEKLNSSRVQRRDDDEDGSSRSCSTCSTCSSSVCSSSCTGSSSDEDGSRDEGRPSLEGQNDTLTQNQNK